MPSLSQLPHQPVKHFCGLLVDLRKVTVQPAAEQQRGIQHRAIFFDVPQMLSASHSDGLGISFILGQTRDVIIALQFIPKTVAFIKDILFHDVVLLKILS